MKRSRPAILIHRLLPALLIPLFVAAVINLHAAPPRFASPELNDYAKRYTAFIDTCVASTGDKAKLENLLRDGGIAYAREAFQLLPKMSPSERAAFETYGHDETARLKTALEKAGIDLTTFGKNGDDNSTDTTTNSPSANDTTDTDDTHPRTPKPIPPKPPRPEKISDAKINAYLKTYDAYVEEYIATALDAQKTRHTEKLYELANNKGAHIEEQGAELFEKLSMREQTRLAPYMEKQGERLAIANDNADAAASARMDEEAAAEDAKPKPPPRPKYEPDGSYWEGGVKQKPTPVTRAYVSGRSSDARVNDYVQRYRIYIDDYIAAAKHAAAGDHRRLYPIFDWEADWTLDGTALISNLQETPRQEYMGLMLKEEDRFKAAIAALDPDPRDFEKQWRADIEKRAYLPVANSWTAKQLRGETDAKSNSNAYSYSLPAAPATVASESESSASNSPPISNHKSEISNAGALDIPEIPPKPPAPAPFKSAEINAYLKDYDALVAGCINALALPRSQRETELKKLDPVFDKLMRQADAAREKLDTSEDSEEPARFDDYTQQQGARLNAALTKSLTRP